jgi:cell division protein FtsL
MSDTNIPIQIAETLTNIVKKGNIFEKIKKIENLLYGCGILVTIFGSSMIVNSFFNTQLLVDINSEQDKYQTLIDQQTHNVKRLQYKVDKLLVCNEKLLGLLFEERRSTLSYGSMSELNNDKTVYINSTISSLTYDLSNAEEDDKHLVVALE